MYNKELKERFLEYYKEKKSGKQSMINRAENVFKRVEAFEQKWGKDLCLQDEPEEIQKLVDEVSSVVSGTTSGQLLVLRDYCNWCLNNNIDGASNLLQTIRKPTSEKLKNMTFANPLQLQVRLNQIFQPEQDETSHNMYRALLWLAFMGFTESEAWEIKSDEVNLDKMEIIHDNIVAKIYQEAEPSIRNCKELNYFRYTNSNYKEETINRPKIKSDLLLRGLKAEPGKWLNSELSRAQTNAIRAGKIEGHIKYSTVFRSGVFYIAFQQEQTGIKPSFRGIAIRSWIHIQKQKTESNDYEYDPRDIEKKKRVDLFETNFKRDYKRWKSIHYGI